MVEFINKIIVGECVDVIKNIPDEAIDLVVTSPPYGSIRGYKNGYEYDFEELANQLKRTLKPGGVIVWVVGDQTIDGGESLFPFKQAIHFKEICGLTIHDTMIYKKKTLTFPDANRYYAGFEYMFVISKGKPKTFNPIKDRRNITAGQKVHGLERKGDGEEFGERACAGNIVGSHGVRFNVWEYDCGGGKTTKDKYAFKHPALMPEKMAFDHIRSWSNPGDMILDPFNGAGTTTKMAAILDRKYCGIDVSEDYCEIARKRIAQYSGLY